MKICLFADSFLPRVGGMEFVIHNLAESLQKNGCDVTVMAKRVGSKGYFDHGYRLLRYGGTFPGSGRCGFDFLSGVLMLTRQHQISRFDVVNCHGISYAGSRVAFAKKLREFPLVMTPHGEDVQRIPEISYGLRLNTRWDAIIRRNLGHADAVTAISDSIKNELSFMPSDKLFIIPNGIDTGYFRPGKSTYLHGLLSMDRRTKIVLSVGRKHIKKGYEFGIQTFGLLKETYKYTDLAYVIIGRDSTDLQPLIDQLQLTSTVYLVPQMDNAALRKCYQSAWCFFSPSIVEGLSIVSLEAMATGLPLVVTDVPGNVDIVRDNQCGLVVKNKDPRSMAEGIAGLYERRHEYQNFRKASLEHAHLYDWDNTARRYLEIYKMAIAKSRGSNE